jgi:cytochrome c-L
MPGVARRPIWGRTSVCLLSLIALATRGASPAGPGETVTFRHIVDDAPLDVGLRPDEPLTDAVRHFHAAGKNLYVGRTDAIAEGRQHYETWCQSCHLPDGSGRIGPSLIDDQYGYERTKTDVGVFEIILGGGTGAMQPFRDRLTQDQILKVIAYLHALKQGRTASD